MANLTERQERALRLAYFVVGAAVPLIGWKLWDNWGKKERRAEIDDAQDITLEDSFPASDPPSSW
jgi:hypothetical protein